MRAGVWIDIIESAMNEPVENYDLFRAKIVVCGVGGGGSNTIERMSRVGIKGTGLVAINTDAKQLNNMNPAINRVLIGGSLTRGMGAGGFPEMGAKAADYSRGDIDRSIDGANMVFLTAGMGGGTGTGAAPVVAEIAKRAGAIVVGIVTFPFSLERVRINVARKGIEELKKNVDTLIVIDNQRLVDVYPNLAIEQAFKVADEVALRAVKGIAETINTPSLINTDFADIRTIMNNGGIAMISVGEGKGNDRVKEVVASTLRNKLLDVDYEGCSGILIHIRGGNDLTLGDANEIAAKLTEQAAPNANVIWGARIDPDYNGRVEVIAIFTGVQSPNILSGSSSGSQQGSGFGGIADL
ncbi:MAG: cell division protein FtsZ [Candidatus Micrarchaeota archaeon]|nr:cell division protein FtsZ [Candidatus Micrarchaeota archaeon]